MRGIKRFTCFSTLIKNSCLLFVVGLKSMFAADVTTVQEAAQLCWVWREKEAVLGGGVLLVFWCLDKLHYSSQAVMMFTSSHMLPTSIRGERNGAVRGAHECIMSGVGIVLLG